ncbi:hypothetical protein FOZ61_006204 [Perkinsus olseni]|uniref:Ran-binding protein 10 n=1 Tax=Perkinsus olseni TaxID=32597 RepID=A0A7J6MSY6_PEROL|nr:hypothetical protein FOZ61_006204 [Perkinsus olseni]KAF4674051.1 hypothetical protein FOL46_005912 [Perkinsus olseni]
MTTITVTEGDRDIEYILIGTRPAASESRPSCLSLDIADDSPGQLVEIGSDGLTATYIGRASHADVAAVQADHPVPLRDSAFYFEMTVLDTGTVGAITIGLTTSGFLLNRQPGWEIHSFGYRGDDGRRYSNSTSGESFGPTFSNGDTVGCLVDYALGVIRYTKNGKLLAPVGGRVPRTSPPLRFYPTISLHSPGAKVMLNFGKKPFVFDLHRFEAETLERQRSAVESYSDEVTRPLTEKLTQCDSMIRAFLLARGYHRTLERFDRETGTPQTRSPRVGDSSRSVSSPLPKGQSNGHDPVAANGSTGHLLSQLAWSREREIEMARHVEDRSKVREAIMQGDISSALRMIEERAPEYPAHDPPLLGYVLLLTQCFIEMMNGRELNVGEALAWMHKNLVPVRKRILSCSNGPDSTKSLAVLREVSSLLAYRNIAESPLRGLLHPSRRRLVADLVNDDLIRVMSSPSPVASTRFAGWSPVHVALRQLIATKQVLHAHHMGGTGPVPDSRLLCHGIHKATKWVEVANRKVKND